MTLTLHLPPDLETRLAAEAQRRRVPLDACALRLIDSQLPASDRAATAVALLQEWMDDADAAGQKQTGDWLVQALDEDRTGQRQLYSPTLKGVTW